MNRVVLITGVAGGIGTAIAKMFATNNWSVIGVDLQNENDNLSFIKRYFQVDISDTNEVQITIEQIKKDIGRIDALINNGAIQICKPITKMDTEEWDKIMAVNVRSSFLFSKEAYPLLKINQGSIVNISSVHAIATSKNIAAYAASKGALLAFSRALALEFAPDQIRVNAILPGAVDTPMLHAGLKKAHLPEDSTEELITKLKDKTILGRIGKPEEIAHAALFLADNQQSSFMTGQALIIDGGAIAKLSTE